MSADHPGVGADATSPVRSSSARSRWDELDLLRGIAGVLMVANHTGYKWLGDATLADPVVRAIVFAGSCAPVVFFTTSGIGYGLQVGSGRAADPWGLARKVVILLVADALLWIGNVPRFGLDFLGFIGLSMLVLDPLRRARRAVPLAVAGIAAITVLRYGVGEAVKGLPGGTGEVMRAALGVGVIEGVSYPLLPWLAYPLTGFLLGAAARDARAWVDRRFAIVIAGLFGLALGGGTVCAWLVHGGRQLHRWGYVSLAFYAASFVAIALTVALALVLARHGGALARRLLELRGVASLALVPWHYAVIYATAAVLFVRASGRWGYLAGTVAMIAASFALSRHTERFASRSAARAKEDRAGSRRIVITLACGVALAFLVKLLLLASFPDMAVAAVVAGQVLLCVAFALEPVRVR
jgi:uncharacterized membrane protein